MQKKLRILLDLDQCLFDWIQSHEQKFNCKLINLSQIEITHQVFLCKYDKNFWENLQLLEYPDFEPQAYVTKRINPKSYTKNCLIKNNLPLKRIYQIENYNESKAPYVKRYGDILIDDDWTNVQQCLNSGVPALLITRPHNKNINTPYRVDHLKYSEIKAKYDQLFGSMQNKVSKH